MSNDQQEVTQDEEGKSLTSDKKDDERYLEELRLKYNFWKFLLGSVVVVLITAILNFAIGWTQLSFDRQQKQQELEALRLQNEREFLAKFIEQALDVNLEARIRFSHYLASLTDPEGQGKRWTNYHETLLATATSESSELAIKKATVLAIEVEQATVTAQAKITATHVAKQLEENLNEFAPTATQIAEQLSEQDEKLQEVRLEAQQEVQRLENELIRQKTPTPTPKLTAINTPLPTATQNMPPVVQISHEPANPISGDQITFTAIASDDRTVQEVQIWANGDLLKSCPSSECTVSTQPSSSGNIQYWADAIDDAGLRSQVNSSVAVSATEWNVTVFFSSVFIENNAEDDDDNGEIVFEFKVNDQTQRWPSSGEEKIKDGQSKDILIDLTETMKQTDKLTVFATATEKDSWPDDDDAMGTISVDYTIDTMWGEGSHEEQSNCPEGCYILSYDIIKVPNN